MNFKQISALNWLMEEVPKIQHNIERLHERLKILEAKPKRGRPKKVKDAN